MDGNIGRYETNRRIRNAIHLSTKPKMVQLGRVSSGCLGIALPDTESNFAIG